MSQDSRRAILTSFLQRVVDSGFTGGVACLVSCREHVFEVHLGDSTPEKEYDLASLTKILCTTYLSAQAVVQKKIKLDEQPWTGWPGVTVEQVLAHRAGLPAWSEVSSLSDVFELKPMMPVQTVYSDIGFIALGALLEERLGAKLDVLFKKQNLHFHGGLVDDANCRRLGGVAGHSGLFGTLQGVYEEAKFFLKCLIHPESPLEHKLKSFAEYPGPRGLGFDKPSPGGSTGEALSEKTVGHLGYTGTSVWIDPVQEAIYILLMKRLDRGEKKEELLQIRRRFHQI